VFKRIVAATDGSDGATVALKAAIALAAANKGALTVLNVFNPAETMAGRHSGNIEFARAEHLQGDYAEGQELLSENVLETAKKLVAKRRTIAASFVSLEGDPATEIRRYADEIDADTIVLGCRGLGRFTGLIFGSVSQQVASHARQITVVVTNGSAHGA